MTPDNIIELTDRQKHRLENLWFVYGNSGSKSTKGNHGYIQGLLEYGEDRKQFYRDAEKNMVQRGVSEEVIRKMRLTPECIDAVQLILDDNEEADHDAG